MKSHSGLVAATASAHVSAAGDIEDLVQESFMLAWRELASLKKPESFAPWVCTIARNLARTAAAERARRARTERTAPRPPRPSDGRDALYSTVIAELEKLPDGYREVFQLRYVAQQDCAGIARALGLPLGTITSRLSRGHQLLRDRLREAARR